MFLFKTNFASLGIKRVCNESCLDYPAFSLFLDYGKEKGKQENVLFQLCHSCQRMDHCCFMHLHD